MKTNSEFNIERHLEEDHANLHSNNIKCFVYGGLDGIITTFAIISSCYGAGLNIKALLILGLSNVLADALSMGFGEFASADLERDYINSELKKVDYEYENNLEEEKKELAEILEKNDSFSKEDSITVVNIFSKYKTPFLELMMKKELELGFPESRKDIIEGSLSTFSSFIVFGLIPLIPYLIVFLNNQYIITDTLFFLSYVCTIFSISLLGYIYIHKTQQSFFYLFKFVFSATIAALTAFIIGYLLESLL